MTSDTARPYTGSFIGDTHHFALRVYIEDTDLGGVVYHANYLRFLERARSDALRALGISQRTALENGEGIYAVAELRIQFRRPARLDDDLIVLSEITEVRGASCVVSQRIMRGADLIADATVKLAFLSPEGKPRRQPAEWVQKFSALPLSAHDTR